MDDPATRQAKLQFEAWFLAQLMKAKAVWLHACYRAILPAPIFNLAAGGNQMAKCQEYVRQAGYSLHEFRGTSPQCPGMTELRKAGLTVAQFMPKLVGEKEEAHLEFEAHILGNPLDVLALMKNTALDNN